MPSIPFHELLIPIPFFVSLLISESKSVKHRFSMEDSLRIFASQKPKDKGFLQAVETMKDPLVGLRGREEIESMGKMLFWSLQKKYLERRERREKEGEAVKGLPLKMEMFVEWLKDSEYVLVAVEVSIHHDIGRYV